MSPMHVPVPGNPKPNAASILRNPESIIPCSKMQQKICLNTPAGLNGQTNCEVGFAFPGTQLETDTSVRKSTRNILCIRKGSMKHHEPLFYFLARNTVYLLWYISHLQRERKRKKLIDVYACVLFSRIVDVLTHRLL